MAWTYVDVNPTLIPNTIMQKALNEQGVHKTYRIRPIDGYVLHDVNYDTFREEVTTDPITGEETTTMIPMLGYRSSLATCSASYAFTPMQMQDDEGNTHTAYGDRQFFTRSVYEVPTDQIFGVVDESEHEIM